MWCEVATVMSAGGTVPGAVPPSPREDTPDQNMLVSSENARFPGETDRCRRSGQRQGQEAAEGQPDADRKTLKSSLPLNKPKRILKQVRRSHLRRTWET